MAKPDALPQPNAWWDEAPEDGHEVVGARDQRILVTVDSEGVLDGPMTIFSAENTPLIEAHWKDGELHGPQTIWKDPFYRAAAFERGKPHGRWTLYWNEHSLVWVEFDEGAQVSAQRQNELNIRAPSKPMFFVNDVQMDSLEAALAEGDDARMLMIAGWTESALPAGVWELENLELLQIFYSSVRPIPADIARLKKLKMLEVKGSDIGWVDPAIAELEALEHIKITESKLGVFPAVANPNLTTIDLTGNIIARINHSLENCPKLSTIILRDTYVMMLDENVFSAPALARIDMAGSFWMSWISPAVGNAKNLVNVTLYEQALHALPVEFGRCAKLQSLNLFGCHLVDAPWMLSQRPISQLNLDQTHVSTMPGLADFEERLRNEWAKGDEATARAVELDSLTMESLGLKPPDAMNEFEAVTFASAVELDELVSGLSSGDFGCENGDYPVEAFTLERSDALATGLFMGAGLLRPCEDSDFNGLALQTSGSELVEKLRAHAPTQPWLLEVLPGRPEDLKVAFLVLQFASDIWGVVGPTLEASPASETAVDPCNGELKRLLRRDVNRFGGAKLWYQLLEREPGDTSTIAFDSTRENAIEAYLEQAGVASVKPLEASQLDRDNLGDVRVWLAEQDEPCQLKVGRVALYQHFWLAGNGAKRAGFRTKTVST